MWLGIGRAVRFFSGIGHDRFLQTGNDKPDKADQAQVLRIQHRAEKVAEQVARMGNQRGANWFLFGTADVKSLQTGNHDLVVSERRSKSGYPSPIRSTCQFGVHNIDCHGAQPCHLAERLVHQMAGTAISNRHAFDTIRQARFLQRPASPGRSLAAVREPSRRS